MDGRSRSRGAGTGRIPGWSGSKPLNKIPIWYLMNMRKPVSITLEQDNVLWLRAQAAATSRRSVSEVVDQLVTEARQSGRTDAKAVRSVVGTVDLPADDPGLDGADTYIRAQFEKSVRRPILVKESAARYSAQRTKRG